MGSTSVDLKGYVGRPLRAGDLLGQAERRAVRPGRSFVPHRFFSDVTTLRLLPGPQPDPDALAGLFENTFTVASADRMGVRFEGAAVPGGEVLSEAVPLGAVQVTPGGVPILLLHDRGTLGGYAKPAVLHPLDLGRAAQLRPGARVRFLPAGK
jgi:allophanate hydrolase subunit 2